VVVTITLQTSTSSRQLQKQQQLVASPSNDDCENAAGAKLLVIGSASPELQCKLHVARFSAYINHRP